MSNKVTLEIPSGCEVILRTIDRDNEKKCSFCGKHRLEVRRLIIAKNVSICNECVELSHEILIDENIISIKEKEVLNIDKKSK